MSPELKIAVCQMTSVDDVRLCLEQMESLIARVPEDSGVRLFLFPENCLYLRIREGESIPPFSLEDQVFRDLSVIAKKRKAFLHLGSVPLLIGDLLYNSSVIITDQGKIESNYQKVHLFDIQLSGQASIRESDVFKHGMGPGIFSIDGWKIAQSICYDVRFAELYSQYAREPVDLILIPSAFLVKTGEAHWEILLRARAIESQCYVAASAQAGRHHSQRGETVSRETYGNSMVVEPWGGVLARLDGERPQTHFCTLSKVKIETVRNQIPMAQHRRISLK
ncbi:MAG: carbon-nitrogen hydrolase family protein [Bdellovibrionaceae bacterium]|nr:carbon-nitrogen hydrolase family protein [Pseudobdellovibrionaceae bacterium]